VALLVLVLVPFIGREVNGARRWLPLGPVNLQPSELMKLFAVLYAADYTVRKLADMGSFRRGFVPMALVMALVGGLLLREPDFGAFVVIHLHRHGHPLPRRHQRAAVRAAVPLPRAAFVVMIWTSPYRRERIFGFMDPWSDAFGKGYQLSHALIAFGRGEWFGVGLGGSVEKLFYLPGGAHRFPARGDRRGTGPRRRAGGDRAVRPAGPARLRHRPPGAAARARLFGGLVAQGIGIWLGVQAFINMGVNMGLLPTKGLTLPLMSFGGSGILANCVALAILLRVDYENRA
jgi:cell division protein FtsW